jgi:stress-induced morphogen
MFLLKILQLVVVHVISQFTLGGQMYKIVVESPDFANLSKVDQHKIITNALAN